jgi:hypothetical protein
MWLVSKGFRRVIFRAAHLMQPPSKGETAKDHKTPSRSRPRSSLPPPSDRIKYCSTVFARRFENRAGSVAAYSTPVDWSCGLLHRLIRHAFLHLPKLALTGSPLTGYAVAFCLLDSADQETRTPCRLYRLRPRLRLEWAILTRRSSTTGDIGPLQGALG